MNRTGSGLVVPAFPARTKANVAGSLDPTLERSTAYERPGAGRPTAALSSAPLRQLDAARRASSPETDWIRQKKTAGYNGANERVRGHSC
jgi:hypothetical protein